MCLIDNTFEYMFYHGVFYPGQRKFTLWLPAATSKLGLVSSVNEMSANLKHLGLGMFFFFFFFF
jgi:hypothetical protein